jgi:hypothetical protein
MQEAHAEFLRLRNKIFRRSNSFKSLRLIAPKEVLRVAKEVNRRQLLAATIASLDELSNNEERRRVLQQRIRDYVAGVELLESAMRADLGADR